ncbi:MAG TPA: hypothetical protein VIK99_03605, partial [Thermaerobacter sp.]
MWPYTAFARQHHKGEDDGEAVLDTNYILIEDTDYLIQDDADDEDAPPARRLRRRPGAQRGSWFSPQGRRWLMGALGAWVVVLALGLVSTPFRDGRPVLATPGYRHVAAHAVTLDGAVAQTGAWDGDIERALEQAGEPFDLANQLRKHAEAAAAEARRLGLLRVPDGARAEHLALAQWL